MDEEQQYITDLAHRRALKLVAENRPLLEAFASTLLDNEVLERDDIERIVAAYRENAGGDVEQLVRAVGNGSPTIAAAEGARLLAVGASESS